MHIQKNFAPILQRRRNQLIILIVGTLGLFSVTFKWQFLQIVFSDVYERIRSPLTANYTVPFECENNNLILPEEKLTEDDIMDIQCDDIKTLASAENSKLYIFNNEVSLGDQIRLSLAAFDGYGKAKTNGGDQFRAAMKTPAKHAYTNGVVTDYDNGTYDIIFEALWTGNVTIEVTLAYTKEAFAALYRLRLKTFPIMQIGGKYSHNGVTETVLCHPDPAVLASYHICDNNAVRACRSKLVVTIQNTCNFTSWNGGFPLFCTKPKNKYLRCDDMMFVSTNNNDVMPNMTNCEQKIIKRCHQRLKKTISVTILPDRKQKNTDLIFLPQTSCKNYNRTALWSTKNPTGFFFQSRWHLRHCKGVEIKNKHLCLKDRRLYIIGDSTVRQWFLHIKERYNCTQYTEKWTKIRWYKLSSCRNSELNFTATYAVHGLPFYVGAWVNISLHLTSIAQRMDKIPDNENAIFVFHMYQHMTYYCPRYFRLKMEAVRLSAERLLDRNKYVKIMVKGPHVFGNNKDVLGNVYTRILYEVFRNLHDRIIFLNNLDASIAVQEKEVHPRSMVVEAMVDQMIVFACN